MVTQHRCVVRFLIAVLVPAAIALILPASAATVPDPPPDPGADRIEAGNRASRSKAERVRTLTDRLAAAESHMVASSARVELKMEDTNKARVDLQRAERGSAQARQAGAAAEAEAAAAALRVDQQRARLDAFAAGSYRQGSKLGSLTAFFGSKNPQDVLDRAEMLETISSSELDVLGQLERARAEKAAKDSAASTAMQEAEAKQAAAIEAGRAAETAEAAAVTMQRAEVGQARRLEADKASVQAELAAARAQVDGLEAQRERYRDWLEAKQREEAAGEGAAPQAMPAPASSDAVESVVQRALSQVGVSYAWGGGDASGPTRGIRDGGVADAHGDYRKVGFDCSGLMIYAFAAAGIELDHYSGYQYQAGQPVPLTGMRRGDLLFWQDSGSTHHVALYLGDGKMVEAPYSGSSVRVTPVRHNGIAPHAVRIL